ncbi:hypothetical protein [Ruegeria faecimaris]|uniref:Uncharacterized protein n=1 Tax=Ruegeria faecimaris TaxID=686389 RepID=A0A521AEI9_9RHOB|nr:hypothetical protein [Ruegeria faecimaris]SMO33199.1 hypothetical protein SAMN06265380_10173 [Ruegeria faecimaris]
MNQNQQFLKHILQAIEEADIPDQGAAQSWAFEPYLRLNDERTQVRLDATLQRLCSEWQSSYARKRNAQEQREFRDCSGIVLINVLRAHVKRRGMSVGIGRQKQRLDRESRYRPAFMTTHRFRMALDWLLKTDLICITAGGYQYGDNAQHTRFAMTPKAIAALYTEQLTMKAFEIVEPDEVLILRDSEKQPIRYHDTEQTIAMRNALVLINNVNANADVTLSRPLRYEDLGEEYVDTAISVTAKHLRRIFNNGTFDQGGRFYGAWWQCVRKHVRRIININGEATIEADYRGFNPAVLLAKAKFTIPADPYSVIKGVAASSELRDHAKSTLAAFLNAQTRYIAEPRGFDASKHCMTAAEFRQTVLDAYPMINQMIGQDAGLKLQREESNLAEKIMLHFVRQGHPILPVHDAFIVQAHLRDELVSVMKDQFNAKYGQVPEVEVKDSLPTTE